MKKILSKLGFLGALRAILLIAGIVAVGLTCRALLQLTSNGGLSGIGTVVAGLNKTVTIINQPCDAKDAHGLTLKPGTLCQVGNMTTRIGDIAVTSQIQVHQNGLLIQGAVTNMNAVTTHITKLVDSLTDTTKDLGGTARAFAGTADAARDDLKAAQPAIAQAKPLMDASTTTVQNANNFVMTITPDLARFMKSSADGMDKVNVGLVQANGSLTDIHKMTTHLEKDADAPKNWFAKSVPVAGDLIKITACLTSGSCL
jgi:ABC-type transporter Mla subunit MlaD